MKYHVINKKTGDLTTLSHMEVNEMDYPSDGRVIVYGTDYEAYYLLVDNGLIGE